MTKMFVGCCLMAAGAAVSAPVADEIARENAHTQGKTVIAGKSNVQIALDRADAQYRCGEEAVFTVTVAGTNGTSGPVRGKVSWTLDNYGAHVFAKGTVDLAKENPFTVKGTLPYPGFLRVTVRGDRGRQLRQYSAAYEPEKIRTAVPRPDDFDAFWENAVARLEKEVPLDPKAEPVPGYPKKGCMAERVSFATANGKRVHALLTYPLKPGRHPVRLGFPGAGPGPSLPKGNPSQAYITFTMNSHYYRIGDDKTETDALYAAEEGGWRKIHGPSKARAYPVGGLTLSREEAHYYGIILGCNRAINWLMATHRDRIDPARVTYSGASQGGGFGLILTALNKNIRRAYAGVPALTDVLGCKAGGRQSGWPRILEYETQTDPARLAKIEANAPYFDAAYFAERIAVPIRLTVGYIDESCAPHAVCAAFNAIPSKDKKLYHGIGGSHGSPNGPRGEIAAWLDAD